MSADRQRRLNRLLDLRKTELDKTVAELSQAQSAEREAVLAFERACANTRTALLSRSERTQQGLPINEWAELEGWIAEVQKRETLAQRRVEAARLAIAQARDRVARMRVEHGKIERLIARLRERERQEQNRADQKMNDESAAARFLRQRQES